MKFVEEVRDRGRNFLIAGALAMLALSASAQHTTVEKNGVNGKIETDYNAAGKPVEMRTLGPDGKVQQKVDYEYLPGYYVAQQTDTTYWPNGRIRRVTHKSYDESANFIGEFIQTFDEAGKQIGGHKLTHDPWKGTYRCEEWNAAAQDYRRVDCPAGEEEGGGGSAERPKKFTYDEVMKHLEAARKTARSEWEFARLRVAAPINPSTEVREVGIVLPAKVNPGERVSGSVVENPDRYVEMAEVTVTRVAVPFESAGDGSRLSGWLFETAGEEPRRADGPITFVVPERGLQLTVTFRQEGNHAHSISQTLNVSQRPRTESHLPNTFQAAALCMKGALCAVSGPFSGDSSKTFAAFEDRPATIVAETSDTAYLGIPELTGPGSGPLFIAEGSKVVALTEVVGEFFIKNNGRELQAGESLITFPTLDGPGDIADDVWRAGNFPETNLERARQLIPGFELTGDQCGSREKGEPEEKREAGKKREEKEEEKKEEGKILLVVKSLAPGRISLHSSTNGMLVFCLSDEAFQRGAFKYDLRVDALKAGKVEVTGYVIPFLGTVEGQEFDVKVAK
ncbi:MAG: hypothetical protein WCA58_13535 [Terriglobales bacterium]